MASLRTQEACRQSEAYRAWRVCNAPTALPLDIAGSSSLQDAKNEAMLGGGLCHKDTLLIHRAHDGIAEGELHAFAVKRKSQPQYRKCEETGLTKAFHPLYLDELFSLPIREFDPDKPFDAFTDDATGIDRTLVQQ